MKMLKITFILFIIIISAESYFLGTVQIKHFVLTRCEQSENDPISLSNVTVELGNNLAPIVSGVFSTSVDLISPITIAVKFERKAIFWIEVPCVDNVGSCTYKDVCTFGISPKKQCPTILDKNQIPCRCPIKKGTYIIPETVGDYFANTAIYSGKYWGHAVISQNNTRLGCYNTTFELYDA